MVVAITHMFLPVSKAVAYISPTQTPTTQRDHRCCRFGCVMPVAADVALSGDEELNLSTPPDVSHFQTSFSAPTDTNSSDVTGGNIDQTLHSSSGSHKRLYTIYLVHPNTCKQTSVYGISQVPT